jgi:hypothetical protein
MTRRALLFILIAAVASVPLAAQTPASTDSLLERFVGQWAMAGTVRGRPATYALDVSRVLQGKYVELHMTDVHLPPGYEARAFLGADTAGTGVIAHWLDNFGAAYSVPTATGAARGDTLVLNFPYATGAFRDTFVYDRTHDRWDMRLERADGSGGWTLFAQYEAHRR